MKEKWKAIGISVGALCYYLGLQLWVSLVAVMFLLGDLVHKEGIGLFVDTARFTELYLGAFLENITLYVLISNVLTVLILWPIYHYRGKRMSRELHLQRTTGRNMVMSILFGIGMCFTVELLTGLLPIPEGIMDEFRSQHNQLWFGDAGITFLSVALVGPITEEIIFRGICYGRLRRVMGPWGAGIISSVLFGIAHGDPVWFLVGFVAGAALSWLFETTRSLWPCIVVHVTNNAISSITAYFPMTMGHFWVLTAVGIVLLILSFCLLRAWNRPCRREEPAEI